jgi:hypothetical protein
MTRPVSRAIRCAAALSLLFGLVGCGSTPETYQSYQPPPPPPTPLQACYERAGDSALRCSRDNFLKSLQRIGGEVDCDMRRMNMEDMCRRQFR